MEISSHKIKKILIFSQKKLFLYFGKWNFLTKLLIFQEETLRARKKPQKTNKQTKKKKKKKKKKRKKPSEKLSYILGNGTLALYFSYILGNRTF